MRTDRGRQKKWKKSRICVKNLPKYVAEDRLREFFSQKGEVTDAKLMRTTDGKSRQFGFVGFRSEREAEEALRFFNNSFLDTSKITCEIARRAGDPNIPRPWSRHTLKKQEKLSEEKKKVAAPKSSKLNYPKEKKEDSKKESENDDPQLQEFLQVMQPRVKSKLWANDTLTAPTPEQNGDVSDKKSYLKGKAKKKTAPVDAKVDKMGESDSGSLSSEAAEKSLNHDEAVSDMDYFRSRVKKEWSDSESADEDDESEDNEDDDDGDDHEGQYAKKMNPEGQVDTPHSDVSDEGRDEGSSEPDEEVVDPGDPSSSFEKEVLETGRLFVRNLPYTATEDELEEHFSKLGNVSQVHLVIDKETKRSKGFAYVLYTLPESAARALKELDNSIFQGRLLHVMPAKQKTITAKQETTGHANLGTKTFKQQREEERKTSEASGNTRAWNSLFMRPDTVCLFGCLSTVFLAYIKLFANLEFVGIAAAATPKEKSKVARKGKGKDIIKEGAEKEPAERGHLHDPKEHLRMRVEEERIMVVENIARKFGVSKSDLLDREADDLAVRIALGETQVIAETKKALLNAGVDTSSLEEFAAGNSDSVKRSNHVILVKNLPYGASEAELANMFGKFGSLDKIILPPTKTLALVIFLEPAEARAAFRGLAYKRYKDGPLYLEWAPGNILSPRLKTLGDGTSTAMVGEPDAKRVFLEQHVEGVADADIDHDRVEDIIDYFISNNRALCLRIIISIELVDLSSRLKVADWLLTAQLYHVVASVLQSRSLFVKNLNFKTSDESLKKHFTEHVKEGRILSVRVKKHLKNGKNVSMGFGFIEFDSVDTAMNICRDLQRTVLDSHALILQLCHAKKDERVNKVKKDQSSTKLIVRNVAFEATEKELRHLFSPFGQIKSLRLPMRFGNHRGFAFVEYVTKQEAQNALEALSSTHFYGRHLVLERAKEGESLEELRARTAAQFTDEQSGYQNPTKLSKKRKHLSILDEGSVKFERLTD
ncbi:hypothetical protein RJ639_045469 [Escallonia herrerae]|uniref:RRM domain-containing protein n=1 Tax=Escallonia herrerae TaxID=1293975 RepID=A0AA89AZ48_9ASTE|nr:hypothetical protein RJ639_045469 [Escallonia herrerae]